MAQDIALYISPSKTKPLLMWYSKESENTVSVSISKRMADRCCLYFAWSVELLRINSGHDRFPLRLYPLCVLLPSTATIYVFGDLDLGNLLETNSGL